MKAAGTKGTGTGQLGEPTGLDVDPSGNVWVADWQNNRVSRFNANGEFLGQFGSLGSGDGQFNHPDEIEIDKLGGVWIGDQGNNRIQQFDLSAQFKAKFGSSGTGQGQFSFAYPLGIAADSKGHLYVADTNNHRLQEWLVPLEKPTYISSFGAGGSADGQLKAPADIALAGSSLWVVDKNNNRIQKLDTSGKYLAKFGSLGSGEGQFNRPTSIAVDRDGNLLVVDSANNRIQKFDPSGQFISTFGAEGTGNGQLAAPEGIATDFDGNIWVSDTDNGRLQKFDENGNFLQVVGSKGSGTGQLGEPTGMDIDGDGNVWVADWLNNRVSIFSPSGTFLAGFGSGGSGPGQFNRPDEIEIDGRGNVWVGDQNNNRIQRFDLQGNYIGQFGSFGVGEGQLWLGLPLGIAADRLGRIWVTDVTSNRIQRWQLGNYVTATPELDLSDGDPRVTVETPAGLVAKVAGNAAGTHVYTHSGDDLTATSGPEGESKYEYDASGRMTRVTLANGTWGSIAYQADGRVKSVTVDPAGSAPAKTTTFEYSDLPRRTVVVPSDAPHVTYDLGDDGSVLKWWNALQPPAFDDLAGGLYENRNKEDGLLAGDQYLDVQAHSEEGIASIDVIANGNQLVHETNCEQTEAPGIECKTVVSEWVTNTELHAPGHLQVEVLVTDRLGQTASERFWVDIPPPPPPPAPGTPIPPKFADVLKFREDYGLEIVFPVANEIERNERIFNLINAWYEGEPVARASWERWGVPLRPADVAELEYRQWFYDLDAERINRWVEETSPSSFGGYYIDHRAGGIMHIGFTANQAENLASLVASLSLVGGERLQVYPNTPTSSYLSVQASAESVLGAIESNSALREQVVSVDTDEAGGAVRIGTPNVAQVESTLHQMFGANAPITVEFEEKEGDLLGGRYRNTGRMRAGDGIFTRHYTADYPPEHDGNFTCTAGFGAKDRAEDVPGKPWRLFVLTAGHCNKTVWEKRVYRSTDSNNLDESHWREVGEVTRKAYRALGESPTTDAEAIRVEDTQVVPQGIWGSDGGLLPTEPAGTAKKGDTLCFSGVITGVSHGQVIGRTSFWAGAHDGEARYGYWVHFNHHAEPGDSGAPVYNCASGRSIGLVSAGRHKFTQTLVQPLLTPPGMKVGKAPGVLDNPYMRPLSLKLGG